VCSSKSPRNTKICSCGCARHSEALAEAGQPRAEARGIVASGALQGQRLSRRTLAACDKRFFTAPMIGERFSPVVSSVSAADTAMSGGNSASSASWYKCRSSTDISPALLNSLPLTMIFAFSFAASRAPEWSSAVSSTARSYAALTSDGISSAFAYSRPLNRILVLGLALTTKTSSENYFSRNSSAPSFASTWTVWPSRTLPSRISMLSGSRISLWMARRKGRAP